MATGPTRVKGPHDGRTFIYDWTLAANETGPAVVVPHRSDKTVQAWGTFGGNLSIEGSLEGAGATNFAVLTNPGGTALSGKTAAFLETILQNVNAIRPVAGAGVTSVTVRLMISGTP